LKTVRPNSVPNSTAGIFQQAALLEVFEGGELGKVELILLRNE